MQFRLKMTFHIKILNFFLRIFQEMMLAIGLSNEIKKADSSQTSFNAKDAHQRGTRQVFVFARDKSLTH